MELSIGPGHKKIEMENKHDWWHSINNHDRMFQARKLWIRRIQGHRDCRIFQKEMGQVIAFNDQAITFYHSVKLPIYNLCICVKESNVCIQQETVTACSKYYWGSQLCTVTINVHLFSLFVITMHCWSLFHSSYTVLISSQRRTEGRSLQFLKVLFMSCQLAKAYNHLSFSGM